MRHLWLVAFVIGCGGGGSGGLDLDLDLDKRLVTLTIDELTVLCEYLVETAPPRTVTCPTGDVMAGFDGTVDECVEDFVTSQTEIPDCQATVGEYQTCIDATTGRSDEQICDPVEGDNIPPECAPLFTTACGFD